MKRILFGAITLGGLLMAGALVLSIPKATPVYRAQSIHTWIDALASSDYQVRAQAVEAMEVFGPEAIPYLVHAFGKEDFALHRLLPGVARSLPFFRPNNSPQSALVRQRAAEQLGLLGKYSPLALAALVSGLDEKNPDVLSEIERALRRSGPESGSFLIRALEQQHPVRRRRGAAEVLIDLVPQTPTAIPALVRALQDRDEVVRSRSAQA